MDDKTTTTPMCSKCYQQPAGPGGILCPDCLEKITNTGRLGDPAEPTPAGLPEQQLTQKDTP